MISKISSFRQKLMGSATVTQQYKTHPELLDFLGTNNHTRVTTLLERIVPGVSHHDQRKKRTDIFKYIIKFWERSLVSVPYMSDMGVGKNLAKYPFMSPSGKGQGQEFGFFEQYRWDTYFQNRGLLLAGGYDLAQKQLLNLGYVFEQFHRIPNALSTSFLSHGQPPLEAFSLVDLLHVKKGEWVHKMINVIEQDLFFEWWDEGSEKVYIRQTEEVVKNYGLLTRNTPMHFHPLLSGCEDGKDHNWVTAIYGYNYLPVQLNAIIHGILSVLIYYYREKTLGNDRHKALLYENFQERLLRDFNKAFWVESGKWKGFRNYSIIKGHEGHIRYGDLAAEVWPLFVKLATQEQAEITKNNLEKYYKGDYGLATTSVELRNGGSIENEPPGNWEFQWEYPNCWPPLMLIATEGLRNYGYVKEALEYEKNWVDHIEKEFERIGGFPEKNAFSSHVKVEPGFYGVVKGFGWTIAVYLQFLRNLSKSGVLH